MLENLLLILAAFYAVQMMLVPLVLRASKYPPRPDVLPSVSIIVAARNEERNIRSCLDSLTRLSYPQHLLQIIVVDDRSTDATQAIIREYAEAFSYIHLVESTPEEGRMAGKALALAQGVDRATGSILLFTDADCIVGPNWVEGTVRYYEGDRIGLVAGFTLMTGNSWFERMQALDWLFLVSIAAAAVRLRFPITAVGTNLSIRRDVYERVGGFRGIPFSITEDLALFRAVTTTTPFEARLPLDQTLLVRSMACRSYRELLNQKVRWFAGGRGMESAKLVLFGSFYLFYIALILSLLLQSSVAFIVLGAKTLLELAATLPALLHFRKTPLVRYFLHFELYLLLYVVFLPLMVIRPPQVVWKERLFEGTTKKRSPPV